MNTGEGASRARRVLAKAASPLPEGCLRLLERDLSRVLADYFELKEVRLRVQSKDGIVVELTAEAERARSFGVLG